ncbi:hypothetical protein [Hyunsoonleella rubra]|uniref:Tetratricopeptide repeat protein n=1 Tax=Hyunsoonleella rubra TaxID=1737062 RepID=A0ABW5T812_9FLAO
MEDQNYIEFEAYLSEELSAEECADFESRLETDPEFQEAFETYKELSSFLEHKFGNEEASLAFQNNLENLSKAHFEKTETQTKSGSSKTYVLMKYLVAASVAIVFGLFTFNQLSTPSYADYDDYGTISLTVRGNNDALLKPAEDAFNTGNFEKANEAFGELLSNDDSNIELQLYKGISLLELNRFDEADSLFGKLSADTSAYKNKATWYLALSKLKQKDYDACLQILKTIPEDADDYKQAQKLIKKLD